MKHILYTHTHKRTYKNIYPSTFDGREPGKNQFTAREAQVVWGCSHQMKPQQHTHTHTHTHSTHTVNKKEALAGKQDITF